MNYDDGNDGDNDDDDNDEDDDDDDDDDGEDYEDGGYSRRPLSGHLGLKDVDLSPTAMWNAIVQLVCLLVDLMDLTDLMEIRR